MIQQKNGCLLHDTKLHLMVKLNVNRSWACEAFIAIHLKFIEAVVIVRGPSIGQKNFLELFLFYKINQYSIRKLLELRIYNDHY